jgi:hypothetical protein
MKKILITITLLIAIPSLVFSADRLIVKDNGGSEVFTVQDTGVVFAGGTDTRNTFSLIMAGHTGGDSHAQIVTNDNNSRLTSMASDAADSAPRFQAIGPEDAGDAKGTIYFDYGSNQFDLTTADFLFRHWNTGGQVNMMKIFGRDAVTFPTGNVGIATTNPQHKIQVTDGGAWSDGTNWVDVSSREAKDNILELKTEEALETLKNIKPVKYSYKQDPEKETNVGFIAEDVPDLVATKGRKGMVSMEVVAVLTKVVQQQQEMIAKLTERINNLEER